MSELSYICGLKEHEIRVPVYWFIHFWLFLDFDYNETVLIVVRCVSGLSAGELSWICCVQDVDDAHCIRYPKLYLPGIKDALFNIHVFSWSVIEGIISSLVLFFIPYGAFVYSIDQDGIDKADLQSFGTVVAATLVVAVNLRVSIWGEDCCGCIAWEWAEMLSLHWTWVWAYSDHCFHRFYGTFS